MWTNARMAGTDATPTPPVRTCTARTTVDVTATFTATDSTVKVGVVERAFIFDLHFSDRSLPVALRCSMCTKCALWYDSRWVTGMRLQWRFPRRRSSWLPTWLGNWWVCGLSGQAPVLRTLSESMHVYQQRKIIRFIFCRSVNSYQCFYLCLGVVTF